VRISVNVVKTIKVLNSGFFRFRQQTIVTHSSHALIWEQSEKYQLFFKIFLNIVRDGRFSTFRVDYFEK